MADKKQLDKFQQIIDGIEQIDTNKLLRSDLGTRSLEKELRPKLEEIKKKGQFILRNAPLVHNSHLAQVNAQFNNILQQLQSQADTDDAAFITQKPNLITSIDNALEDLKQHWHPFVAAAVEARGFLEDEGIKAEYQRAVEHMKRESAQALEMVKQETQKSIEEAKKLAEEIQADARKTAMGVSVEEAQKQFQQAQNHYLIQIILWSLISLLVIGAFVYTAHYFLTKVKLPEEWTWHVIYYSSIRIIILTSIGAVATFALRVLRAHMHMYEHNHHRKRITNSMASFVQSAITQQQRDMILAHLVEAVCWFGTSGLLRKEDDSITAQKMTVDNIMRSVTPSPQAKN